jgi:hypothetical protein
MMEELTRKIAIWATEIGMQAARLPCKQTRMAFLAEQHREFVANARQQGMKDHHAMILADCCIDGAERIMNELLARGVPTEGGRA